MFILKFLLISLFFYSTTLAFDLSFWENENVKGYFKQNYDGHIIKENNRSLALLYFETDDVIWKTKFNHLNSTTYRFVHKSTYYEIKNDSINQKDNVKLDNIKYFRNLADA